MAIVGSGVRQAWSGLPRRQACGCEWCRKPPLAQRLRCSGALDHVLWPRLRGGGVGASTNGAAEAKATVRDGATYAEMRSLIHEFPFISIG